jgi:hypothetical protein
MLSLFWAFIHTVSKTVMVFIAFIAFTETGVRNIRVDVFFFAFLQIGATVVVRSHPMKNGW